jgi:hypothetical protein
VGVGIEIFPKHETSATVANYVSFSESDRLQEKAALMATVRGRVVARSRFGIDGVFGVGALRQNRTSTTESRSPPFETRTTTTDNTSAAFSLGGDAPISIVRHVAVIPQIRLYHLRRLTYQVVADAPDASSWVLAFGVTAGITW